MRNQQVSCPENVTPELLCVFIPCLGPIQVMGTRITWGKERLNCTLTHRWHQKVSSPLILYSQSIHSPLLNTGQHRWANRFPSKRRITRGQRSQTCQRAQAAQYFNQLFLQAVAQGQCVRIYRGHLRGFKKMQIPTISGPVLHLIISTTRAGMVFLVSPMPHTTPTSLSEYRVRTDNPTAMKPCTLSFKLPSTMQRIWFTLRD